jgi:integrase/recombinase XerD
MQSDRKCLPFDQWPEFNRRRWHEGTRTRGLFEVGGAGLGWSPRSREKAERGYGCWLAWLLGIGQLEEKAHPGDRVDRARVGAYVTELSASCAPWTQVCRVQELYDALRVLAPGRNWLWLAELLATLRARARPVKAKRPRLRSVEELIALGEQLMQEAETVPGWSVRRRAVPYRDGLMVALLAYRPLRMKNFAALRLGQHLVQQGTGYSLLISAHETKANVPYEVTFPSALVGALQRYLDHHRVVLLQGERGCDPVDTDALWISEVGTQLDAGVLAKRIGKHTRNAFGTSLPPHWFRDAAATSIAIQDPRHVRDARHVLGHTSLATTERHYNQACSLQASRRHQEMLASLRNALKASKS